MKQLITLFLITASLLSFSQTSYLDCSLKKAKKKKAFYVQSTEIEEGVTETSIRFISDGKLLKTISSNDATGISTETIYWNKGGKRYINNYKNNLLEGVKTIYEANFEFDGVLVMVDILHIDVNGNYNPSNTVMFWDNRVVSLEEQSLVPIKSMEEMRGNIYSEEDAITIVSQRLIDIPEYVVLFNNAFGDNTIIDGDKISKAIAAYERTLIANNSRFDQYYSGDNNALSDIELQGLSAFIAMNCTACHGGPMFSDYELHDLGTPDDGVNYNGVNGQFRTPTLRNLSLTGPYFHNGTFTTLEEAVNFYDDFEQNDADAQSLNFDDV